MTEIVRLSLEEDIGSGDITSQACIPAGQKARGRYIAREALVVAGLNLLAEIYALRGGVDELVILRSDGDRANDGEILATVGGSARTLLECERVALNFLQRLSGVATKTRQFVDRVAGLNVQILDTRKTTPGWRLLEKYAVKMGGGTNHRVGL